MGGLSLGMFRIALYLHNVLFELIIYKLLMALGTNEIVV